jgi:hypothetical protein
MFDTQIHFPDEIADQIQASIAECGETFEQFVQKAVEHELQRRKANDFKSFFSTLQPLESFANLDATTYVDEMRSTSRIINE